jgi:hypothetical protein
MIICEMNFFIPEFCFECNGFRLLFLKPFVILIHDCIRIFWRRTFYRQLNPESALEIYYEKI